MEIRAWQPGDETAILDLFNTTFGKPMSEAFWRWRYMDHPSGGPMVSLAWDGDRLAAHYAASHAPLVVNGIATPAGLSMTTMTHPDYRGQGLFERSAAALYDQMSGAGARVVWGFPNRNSNVPFRRKLKWSAIADIPTLSCEVPQGRPRLAQPLVQAEKIDGSFDFARPGFDGLQGDRRSEILAWRIDRNPVNRYVILTLPKPGGMDGYAILKPYGETDIDLVALEVADDRAYPDLIAGVLDAAAARGARKVNCWSLPCDPARVPYERAGFQATAPVTYFGAMALNGAVAHLDDPRRWRIAMIDSDIY